MAFSFFDFLFEGKKDEEINFILLPAPWANVKLFHLIRFLIAIYSICVLYVYISFQGYYYPVFLTNWAFFMFALTFILAAVL